MLGSQFYFIFWLKEDLLNPKATTENRGQESIQHKKRLSLPKRSFLLQLTSEKSTKPTKLWAAASPLTKFMSNHINRLGIQATKKPWCKADTKTYCKIHSTIILASVSTVTNEWDTTICSATKVALASATSGTVILDLAILIETNLSIPISSNERKVTRITLYSSIGIHFEHPSSWRIPGQASSSLLVLTYIPTRTQIHLILELVKFHKSFFFFDTISKATGVMPSNSKRFLAHQICSKTISEKK